MELAALITPEIYSKICVQHEHTTAMLGEWLFSVAAFGDEIDNQDNQYFNDFSSELRRFKDQIGCDDAFLSKLRHDTLPAFIDDWGNRVDWGKYQAIGFTSTFQQNAASFALARKIKESYPDTKIIFGGANFDDEMGVEYVRYLPFIDYAVIGEGDIAFPDLLNCLSNNEKPVQIPGVAIRANNKVAYAGRTPMVTDLNALPIPIYDEYFERLEKLNFVDNEQIGRILPVESSRGCWWGQKHHCTFCGLNGLNMAYRAKDPERVLEELEHLASKYRVTSFEAVDNILDMKYVDGIFARIEDSQTDYTFFYEIKANLKREQIRKLYKGGVREIQPGIESLSTHILKLMEKGTTMLQNVSTLKWARYYGMNVAWNIIRGFPGETKEDYEGQLGVVKLLSHLQPPSGSGRIFLERFAPYYRQQDRFPIHDIKPQRSYQYIYPKGLNLDKIAYFFDYQMDDTLPDTEHIGLDNWITEWKSRWESDAPDTLFFRRTDNSIFIDDDRGTERRATYEFHGPLAEMYVLCVDSTRTPAQLLSELQSLPGAQGLKAEDIEWALKEFCKLGLMITEDHRYLSLALPSNPNW